MTDKLTRNTTRWACIALILMMLPACADLDLVIAPTSPLVVQASGAVMVMPPQTLDEWVSKAPLIFIGEVGLVVQYLEFAVYGEDGQLKEPDLDAAGNPFPPVPATDFALQVEEVIRDDGAIASGEPIILRMPGIATEEIKELTKASAYPSSYTGDRHLFLLAQNPDGKSYGFYYGPWNRLLIDGEILRVSDGLQQPLHFGDSTEPITLDQFIQHVKSN
jgi:hypothetical protein